MISELLIKKPERTFYLGIILVLALICLLQYACGGYRKGIVPVSTTVVTRDTQWIETQEKLSHIPEVTTITPPVVVKWRMQKVDTASIIFDYLSTRYYSDTVQTKWGDLTVNDSVRENKIVSRSIATDWKFPVVTQHEITRPRGQLYAGFTLHASPNALLEGAGLSLTWKTRRDKMYDAQVYYSLPLQRLIYEGGIKWKLSLRK